MKGDIFGVFLISPLKNKSKGGGKSVPFIILGFLNALEEGAFS